MAAHSLSYTSRKPNFGAGKKPIPGWINLDVVPLEGVDVIHDVFHFPYPFESHWFDYILCSHVLEHVPQIIGQRDGLLQVMAELHRILEPGGTIEVRGPHPRAGIHYFNNPTHYRVITEWTFDGMVERSDGHDSCIAFWSNARFRKMVVRNETFTDPPFDSGLLKSAMRRVPPLQKLLGRPAELVIFLTK